MKNTFAIILFCLGFVANSAAQMSDRIELERRINRYFSGQPDSALRALKAYLQYSDQFSDSLLLRTYNKLGVTYGQLSYQDSARIYFRKGTALADDFPKLRGNLYQNWAQSERFSGHFDTAFMALDSAEKYYEISQFKSGLGMAYTERGTGYLYMDSLVEAISYFKKAIHQFKENKDTVYIIYAQQDLATTYIQHGNYRFALDLYKELLPKLKGKDGGNYYYALINYGDCWFHLKKYDQAEKNYQKAVRFFKQNGEKRFYYYGMSKLGEIAKEKRLLKKSAHLLQESFEGLYTMKSSMAKSVAIPFLDLLNGWGHYSRALEIVHQIDHADFPLEVNSRSEQLLYLNNKKETLAGNKQYKAAYTLGEKVSRLKDSIANVHYQLAQDSLLAQYQNEYHRQQNIILTQNIQLLRNKNQKKRYTLISMSIFLLLLLGGFILFYRKQQKENQLKKESLKHLEASQKNLEGKLGLERQLHEERSHALEEKKRELVAESLQIAEIKNTLGAIVRDSSEASLAQIKRELKKLLAQEEDWNFFKRKFVDVYPGFMEELQNKYPHLTQNDLEFCALLKLNLSNKEMATLLNISHQSVITKRYRLRKKMNETIS